MKNKKLLGLTGVIIGEIIFGFSFVFSKIALGVTIPSVVIGTRFIIAFITLNIFVLLTRFIKDKNGKRIIEFSLKGKPKKDILLLALFQPTIYMIAENYGIVYTSSSFAGVIIGLIPIASIFFDFIILKNKLSIKHIICAVVSIVGIILTTVGASSFKSSFIGLVLLMVAVVAGSLFYVFSKKTSNTYSPLERTYIMFTTGCIFYVILGLVQSIGHFDSLVLAAYKNKDFWISVIYLGVLSSVVAFIVINFGTTYISVPAASICTNVSTVIAGIAGVIILHEMLSPIQIVGMVIILCSVFISTYEK